MHIIHHSHMRVNACCNMHSSKQQHFRFALPSKARSQSFVSSTRHTCGIPRKMNGLFFFEPLDDRSRLVTRFYELRGILELFICLSSGRIVKVIYSFISKVPAFVINGYDSRFNVILLLKKVQEKLQVVFIFFESLFLESVTWRSWTWFFRRN